MYWFVCMYLFMYMLLYLTSGKSFCAKAVLGFMSAHKLLQKVNNHQVIYQLGHIKGLRLALVHCYITTWKQIIIFQTLFLSIETFTVLPVKTKVR